MDTQPGGLSNIELKTKDGVETVDTASSFSDKIVRLRFIRKVYSILCAQLMLTIGIVALFFLDPVKKWVTDQGNTELNWIFWVALVIQLICLFSIACCTNLRRRTPYNYIFLFLFTAIEGFFLGIVCASLDAKQVIMAVVICAAITWALTAFALQTKWDFTTCGGLVVGLLVTLIMFGIFSAIFRTELLENLYACAGALVFSFFIVYDTQLMLGGHHKYSLSPEEYVFAALNLYRDIINLFLYILEMLTKKKK